MFPTSNKQALVRSVVRLDHGDVLQPWPIQSSLFTMGCCPWCSLSCCVVVIELLSRARARHPKSTSNATSQAEDSHPPSRVSCRQLTANMTGTTINNRTPMSTGDTRSINRTANGLQQLTLPYDTIVEPSSVGRASRFTKTNQSHSYITATGTALSMHQPLQLHQRSLQQIAVP